MTQNVENWSYKSKKEIEDLDDKTIIKVYQELQTAMRAFSEHKVPFSDEMVWQLMVIPMVIKQRNLQIQ